MRGGALLFALALAGSGAAWALLVLPVHREAASAAEEMARADVAGAWRRAREWPGPTAVEAGRLEEALSFLAPPSAFVPPPEGMGQGPSESRPKETEVREDWAGSIPWNKVQDLFSWASSRPEGLLSLEVSPSPADPGKAQCRVAFAVNVVPR